MDYQDDLTVRRREALWRQLGVYTQDRKARERAAEFASDKAAQERKVRERTSKQMAQEIRNAYNSDNPHFRPRTPLTQLTPQRQEELEESFTCYKRQRDTLPAAVAFVLLGVVALLWMFL